MPAWIICVQMHLVVEWPRLVVSNVFAVQAGGRAVRIYIIGTFATGPHRTISTRVRLLSWMRNCLRAVSCLLYFWFPPVYKSSGFRQWCVESCGYMVKMLPAFVWLSLFAHDVGSNSAGKYLNHLPLWINRIQLTFGLFLCFKTALKFIYLTLFVFFVKYDHIVASTIKTRPRESKL